MAHQQVLDFAAACDNAHHATSEGLASIFHLNSNTAHLRQHGISPEEAAAVGPADAAALLRRLPVTTYADLRPLAEAAVHAAERGDEAEYAARASEMVGVRPDMWCTTTGTTGVSKYLPMFPERMASANKVFALFGTASALAFPAAPGDKEVFVGFNAPVRTLANGVWTGPVTACGMRKSLQDYERQEAGSRAMFERWSSPVPALLAGDVHTAAYLHWTFALRQRHSVTSISDAFAAGVLLACNVLVDYQAELLADLAAGTAGAAWDPERAVQPLRPPPAEVVEQLAALLEPNLDLAEELKQVFAAGREGLLERLFPRLQCLKCICTGGMAKYVPLLRQLAPSVPFVSGCYAATEGAFGLASEVMEYAVLAASRAAAAGGAAQGKALEGADASAAASAAVAAGTPAQQRRLGAAGRCPSETELAGGGSPRSVLGRYGAQHVQHARQAQRGDFPASFCEFSREAPEEGSFIICPNSQVYYEFLPLDQGAQQEPLRLDALEVGARYELVVTSVQGLWRYRMGDVLRCVGYFGGAPKVLVEGRLSQELNIAGEKSPEPLLMAAVKAAAERALPTGTTGIKDWAARECLSTGSGGASTSGAGHYLFYWELNSPASGSDDRSVAQACAKALEAALCVPGSSYARARAAGKLGPLELRLVAAGAFAAVRELALAAGAGPGQYKPPVVVGKAEQVAALEGRVLAAAVATAR